ncbi:MAG: CDGSH iron-sulfur domain-containing protein [Cyclobacteriaceae bacterium]
MDLPKRAADAPVEVEIEAGKRYRWCSCGLSEEQPFCDDAHKGTGVKPITIKPEVTEKKWFCMCKQTKNPPYCDGSHNG